MEKVVRSKLKNARKLYQDSDFLGCLSLTDEIIQQDENNYHAHVLKAASCDQLGMDDEAADCFWRSIRLDRTNVLAWQVRSPALFIILVITLPTVAPHWKRLLLEF